MKKQKRLSGRERIRLLRLFLDKKTTGLFILVVLFLVITGVIPSVAAAYQIRLFDAIGAAKEPLSQILKYVLVFLLIQIAIQSADYLFSKLNYLFSEKIRLSFHHRIYAKLEKVAIVSFENARFHDLLYRIREKGLDGIKAALINWFDFAKNLIQVISLSIILFQIHWIFPTLIIPFSIPYLFFFRKMNFNHYFYLLDNSSKTRKNHYLIDLLTQKEYAKEVRVFGLFPYFYEYHVRLRDELFEETYRLVKKYTVYAGIISVFKRFIQVACIGIGIYFVFQGRMGVGTYAVLYQTLTQIQDALLKMVQSYQSHNNQQYYLEDIAEFLALPEDSTAVCGQIPQKQAIHFHHVSFAYPYSEKTVLKDIHLTIPFGQKIAIVGENGSGKTTFAYLLAGLYSPDSGAVTVGEQDLKEILPAYQEKIGYIFQDFIQMKGSIRDNVELGARQELTDEEVEEALKLSDAWEFVAALPRQSATTLGFLETDSIELSGGQWQKLAIARAMLNRERTILILDEFAASLDPFSESRLYEKFNQLTKGKTAISISHRLGITQFVDRILVFHEGRIVEDGSHEELMKKHGLYYQMYQAQREIYQ